MKEAILLHENTTSKDVLCYHCGQACEETEWIENKSFCCYGCKTVYEILNANNLCEYYLWDESPGVQVKNATDSFVYLDDVVIRKKVVEYDSLEYTRVRFYIPTIHCSSCIWLLEHLERLGEGIIKCEVNFPAKTVCIDFDPQKIKLSGIASILSKLGYEPQINLAEQKVKANAFSPVIIKLAVAGFCFGNVMLFSFPEYLGLDQQDKALMRIFSWLNLLLSIPVLLYSASDYFRSAAKSFRQRQINIDVPIVLGLLALFIRSTYDIISFTGPGYLDSFTGLVFFLLIGRWFQNKTYESLSFDRDFKSYFPLAVHKLVGHEWKPVIINEISKGDEIKIRNQEIIPADSILLDDIAYIDYSFVTGEAKPVKVSKGEIIYAGGRLIGKPVVLVVDKKMDQSQLTSLWNHEAFRKTNESQYQKVIDRTARNFTWVVIGIAAITSAYWYVTNPSAVWLVTTSVLMVACPCALALTAPFTYGSMLRVFGRHQFYLKNADVIERLASINAVVFDKTGTVTTGKKPDVNFHGHLSPEERIWIKAITSASTHPLSTLISKSISGSFHSAITDFKEYPGKGIEATINDTLIRIGSASFVGTPIKDHQNASIVFVNINGETKGYFTITTTIRKNIKNLIERLGDKCVALLSGDNDTDRTKMTALFQSPVQLLFNQSPHDKLDYVRQLQQKGNRVMMIGDGLNDSGALQQSDVGIAVTEETGVFTPACDGILQGEKINMLDKFIDLAKASTIILKTGFIISFLYNAIALSFAITGHLTPLIAAILMPLSSISVVSFSSFAVNYVAARKISN